MRVSDVENKKDSRLSNPEFRAAVRVVFDDLGVKNCMSNFKKWDSIIDWLAYSKSCLFPTHCAVVDIKCQGQPTGQTKAIDLPGGTKGEALGKLDKTEYKFVRWF